MRRTHFFLTSFVVLFGFFFTSFLVQAQSDSELVENSKVIQKLVFEGKFKEAEPYVQKCLQKVPNDMYFLSQLDIVLNGQQRFQEADQLRNKILEIWNRDHKQAWISKGSPVAERAWLRMIGFAKDYNVAATEYYIPEPLNPATPDNTITNFYKFIVIPKSQAVKERLFKLEMSKLREEYYVLSEISDKGFRQVRPYGSQKPDIRTVLKDLILYLDGPKKP